MPVGKNGLTADLQPDEPQSPGDRLPDEVERAAETLLLVWGRGGDQLTAQVSPPQLRALLLLEKHESMSLGGLGDALGSLPSSVSRLCNRLQAGGLVSRQASDADRREITIRLTANGQALLTRLHTTRAGHLGEVLDRMSPASRQALLRGLREFAGAVLARADQPPPAGVE